MLKSVVLSDGEPCRVRQLGLFELDGRGRDVVGPYRYSLLLATGQITEDEYDIRALDEIPQPPDKPLKEIEQGSDEHFQLQEYDTYLAALAHEKTRIESYHGYAADITAYILANCLDEADRERVLTSDDWHVVYQAALVSELTLDEVASTLENTFQGFLWWAGDLRRAFSYGRRGRESRLPQTVGN